MIKFRSRISDKLRLGIACFTMYVVGSNLFIVAPLLPYIANDFSISIEKAGWLMGVFSIAYAISAPVFGMISDKYSQKYGRKYLIIFGLLIFSGANFLAFIAKNFELMILSRLISGIGSGIVNPSIYAATSDNASNANRGKSLSIIAFGFLFSLLTSALVGMYLKNIFGWNKVFLILSLIPVFLIWPNLIIWSKDNVKMHEHVGDIKNIGKAIIVICPIIFWAMSLYGLYVYLGFGLVKELKLSNQMMVMIFFIWGVGALIGNSFGGYSADYFGTKRTIKNSLILSAVTMLILFFILKFKILWSSALIASLIGLIALVSYPFFPAQQARMAEESKRYLGTLLALNSSALYLGITIGSAIGGLIIQSFGFALVPFFSFIAAILGVLIIRFS